MVMYCNNMMFRVDKLEVGSIREGYSFRFVIVTKGFGVLWFYFVVVIVIGLDYVFCFLFDFEFNG